MDIPGFGVNVDWTVERRQKLSTSVHASMTAEHRRLRGQIAAFHRNHPDEDAPDVLLRDFAAASIESMVARTLRDVRLPLTDEQVARIVAALNCT